MYDDGYHNIANIDYSPVVIEKMARANAERVGMTCESSVLLPARSSAS